MGQKKKKTYYSGVFLIYIIVKYKTQDIGYLLLLSFIYIYIYITWFCKNTTLLLLSTMNGRRMPGREITKNGVCVYHTMYIYCYNYILYTCSTWYFFLPTNWKQTHSGMTCIITCVVCSAVVTTVLLVRNNIIVYILLLVVKWICIYTISATHDTICNNVQLQSSIYHMQNNLKKGSFRACATRYNISPRQARPTADLINPTLRKTGGGIDLSPKPVRWSTLERRTCSKSPREPIASTSIAKQGSLVRSVTLQLTYFRYLMIL